MYRFLKRLAQSSLVLLVGVFFALVMQSAGAYVGTGPYLGPPVGCEVDDLCTLRPFFYQMQIGAGVPGGGEHSVRVGDELEVVGTVILDNFTDVWENPIVFTDDIYASSFGTYYAETSSCKSCTLEAMGDIAGMYSNLTYCAVGDIMTSCNSYTRGTKTRSFGGDIYFSGLFDRYYCRGLSSASSIVTESVCFSPDATTETGDF